MLYFMRFLNDEIEGTVVTAEDEPERGIDKNDTLVGNLPDPLRQLYALARRMSREFKGVKAERKEILSRVADAQGKQLPSADPALVRRFWELDRQAAGLRRRCCVFNALFEHMLRVEFRDIPAEYAVAVCRSWKVVLPGEKEDR